MKRNMLAGIIGCTVVAGVIGTGILPANALGGSCSANKEKIVYSGQPDAERVAARCSSLNSDSKARGRMTCQFETDATTQYFTTLNVTYRSKYCTFTGTPIPEYAKR